MKSNRSRLIVTFLASLVFTGVSTIAIAKFGITKTKVTLPRVKPPEIPLVADTVAVEVEATSPDVSPRQAAIVKGHLEEALREARLYRLVERPRDADQVLRVYLEGIRADVRDEIRMESRNVKVGEREEWDDKKKKMVVRDVYGHRNEPVTWKVADGYIQALIEVGRRADRPIDAGATYKQEFKEAHNIPEEARSTESLRQHLLLQTAQRAYELVSFSPDPVEAMLAVDGELKDGNRLAQNALFKEALEIWNRRVFKGSKEAARLHNIGVAHEALAYQLPAHTSEHLSHLEQAKDHYRRALALDPGEKYFSEPLARIEVSLDYAARAKDLAAELERFLETGRNRRRP